MARKAKFGKKNISIVNRFRRFFNLDEEISQTALSRSARSHLHETTGEANLASYNKTYKEQIAASFQYEHEAPFNYDSKGFESNIAKNFLEGYPGNNPYPLLGTPYCAHDSIRAKEMRAELAAKITRFEAALEQDIEAGVSQERLTTAKAGFMDEIDDFLSACDAEIKNRGPLPPGEAATSSTLFNVLVPPVGLVNFGKAAYNDLSNAATEAAYYAANRYSFEKFKTDLDTHFTQKLDATRQLVESFQLWDPAQLRFDEKDYDATGKTSLTAPQQKAYNDLTAIKKDYDEALFTLLNSLDNDPRLVLKIKALEHATKAAVRKCMDYNRSVTITVADPRYQVNIAASVDSTATAATATTKPPPLENYLDAKLPSLTQAAVDLRVKMNAQFQTPKSRLQQWRFEYDNDSEHKLAVDKALNDPHKTFTDATEAALTAIQALTPKSSNDLALAVHIGKTGSEDGFSQATATTNDTSLTEYQAFAKNEGGVKKPEALSDNPTEKEKTAYETKKQAYAADRSTKLTSLETTHTEEVNRLRKRLFEPKEPEAPSTTTPEQTAATAKYHGAKKLYEEYTKSFDQKKPAPLADNADTAAKEAHATQTKTYEQALTVYQTRQKELETELTTANTPTDETELNNYKKAQEELEQSNKIHAFYHPEETALPDGPNFAQFSAEYHNVSAQLVSLQTDYKDASRKLLAIEFRWDPAQAKTDLATLEADYDRQLKQKTAALDNLNKKVSNFKSTSSDHAIQAAIKTNQDTFINQINTLKQAQKTAFDATTTAAAAERDKADKACQEYHLKYRIYCLQNGPLTGPLTDAQKQAIKKIEPKELLENLSTDPLIDKSLRLGLVSIKANKVNGKTVYRINLTEISSLAAAKNRNSDGTTKTAAFCSYLWSKKSRSEAIRAALNNPDVINDVGIAVDLIMAAKKDPNDKTYRSTFPAYNPDNYNTMLATSMACIAKGIEFNPEKDFDRSFKGASYEASHVNYITGALKDPKRQRIREKYLATIAAYEETFRSAQAFNNVCREVLDGGLKPGDAKDARENPEVARMKKPQQLFIQAVTNFSHHKNTTATKLANLNTLASSDDRNKIFQESITQLKYMDLATIKGLVPDGAGNHGHAAALMGMVLDRRSASDILAMKEREICHLYEALAKKDLGDKHEPVRQQVKQLQQQLKEDYRHIIHLADAQGLNAPEFKQQYQAALQRLFRAEVVSEQTFNAITDGIADIGRTATDTGNEVIQSVASWVHGEPTYGSALPKVDEKLTVDALSSKGYAAEKELEKFTWPIASASSSSEEAAIGALNTLATLSGDIREAREVSAKLVDNRLDTDFTQKVLNDIEAASKETLLETDRLAAIAKLNEALATLKKTQPAATNTQATEAFNAEEALLEAKKAVIEDLTARITAVKSTIASTREAIEKHKAELTGLLPQSAKPPVNFKENFTQLQDLHTLDTELKTLSKKNTTLNTQKMEINALGIKILPEKIKLINAISRAIKENTLTKEEVDGLTLIINLLTTLKGNNDKGNSEKLPQKTITQIENSIATLKKIQALVTTVDAAIEESNKIQAPSELPYINTLAFIFKPIGVAANAPFYTVATKQLTVLNAAKDQINASTSISQEHRTSLLKGLEEAKTKLIAAAKTISDTYKTNLPNEAELSAVEAFRNKAGLRGIFSANEGLTQDLFNARTAFNTTAKEINNAKNNKTIDFTKTTLTYQEVTTEENKLDGLIAALETRKSENLSSPEQREQIENLVTQLNNQKLNLEIWKTEQETEFVAAIAAIKLPEPILSSNTEFYTAAVAKIQTLNELKNSIIKAKTISPVKQTEFIKQINDRIGELITQAITISNTYANTTLPSDNELTAAKAFVNTIANSSIIANIARAEAERIAINQMSVKEEPNSIELKTFDHAETASDNASDTDTDSSVSVSEESVSEQIVPTEAEAITPTARSLSSSRVEQRKEQLHLTLTATPHDPNHGENEEKSEHNDNGTQSPATPHP